MFVDEPLNAIIVLLLKNNVKIQFTINPNLIILKKSTKKHRLKLYSKYL